MNGSNQYTRLKFLIDGKWRESSSEQAKDTFDPGMGSPISSVPFATNEEVETASSSSDAAFEKWAKTPITDRIKYLFEIRDVLYRHFEELAMWNTRNHGKTIQESRGDMRRAIENVDTAIGVAYTASKGENLEQIAEGIDEFMTREPLGTFAIVCPFNFPIMIPFWFIPYALILGDTIVVKPSEIDPLPTVEAIRLIQEETHLPPGIINVIHGGKEVVESLIANQAVKGVTFVGSTPVAKQVFKLAGEHGKRALVNGGAKNSLVVMPDADLANCVPSIISSSFGNAGQRCLAGSNLVAVGAIREKIVTKLSDAARAIKVGYGASEKTDMGPVISSLARNRVMKYIETGLNENAKILVDGRGLANLEYPNGFYLGPTIFENVSMEMKIAKEEIFGPVLGILSAESIREAIDFINKGTDFGNMASIYTTSGNAARRFRREVNAGNIGINIGVAAPSAFFPFGGRRNSFFGVAHAQIDTLDFFTDKKVTLAKW